MVGEGSYWGSVTISLSLEGRVPCSMVHVRVIKKTVKVNIQPT